MLGSKVLGNSLVMGHSLRFMTLRLVQCIVPREFVLIGMDHLVALFFYSHWSLSITFVSRTAASLNILFLIVFVLLEIVVVIMFCRRLATIVHNFESDYPESHQNKQNGHISHDHHHWVLSDFKLVDSSSVQRLDSSVVSSWSRVISFVSFVTGMFSPYEKISS